MSSSEQIYADIASAAFSGIRVVASPAPLTSRVQFRKPKSKKKRIRKKWAKRPWNWKEVEVAYMISPGAFGFENGVLVMHDPQRVVRLVGWVDNERASDCGADGGE